MYGSMEEKPPITGQQLAILGSGKLIVGRPFQHQDGFGELMIGRLVELFLRDEVQERRPIDGKAMAVRNFPDGPGDPHDVLNDAGEGSWRSENGGGIDIPQDLTEFVKFHSVYSIVRMASLTGRSPHEQPFYYLLPAIVGGSSTSHVGRAVPDS